MMGGLRDVRSLFAYASADGATVRPQITPEAVSQETSGGVVHNSFHAHSTELFTYGIQ